MVEVVGEAVVSKSQFAKIVNLSAGRISQLIAEGKIGPEAIVGEGRMAKIRVEVAKAQLNDRLDPGQRLGNGIDTRLEPAGGVQQASAEYLPFKPVSASSQWQPDPEQGGGGTIEGQIKREKLRSAQYQNRKAAEEEEARRGRFVETEAARREMTTVAAKMLQVFEGSLTDLATAVSAQFKVPQRDVQHVLQKELRKVRAKAVEQVTRHKASLPTLIETIIESDFEQNTP